MPATGAPASYKRVRAGFEALAEKKILGRDAADAVAVMAFAQGLMELLPSRDYNDAQPWLFVREQSTGKKELNLPKKCPYEEIYKSTQWWALIPESNDNSFDPAGLVETSGEDDGDLHSKGNSLRDKFYDIINSVKDVHKLLESKYHEKTYVHYCAEAKSEDFFTWGGIEWTTKNLNDVDLESAKLTSDNLDAHIQLNGKLQLIVGEKTHAGDGTVPVYSASAPKGKPGVLGAFAHGKNASLLNSYCKEGKFNNTTGYVHQGAYTDKAGRTLYSTLYSLVRLSEKIY